MFIQSRLDIIAEYEYDSVSLIAKWSKYFRFKKNPQRFFLIKNMTNRNI